MKEDDGAGVDPRKQLIECLFLCGLVVLIPVHIGKAPEYGFIPQLLSHFQVIFTVDALRRSVKFFQLFPRGLFIQSCHY